MNKASSEDDILTQYQNYGITWSTAEKNVYLAYSFELYVCTPTDGLTHGHLSICINNFIIDKELTLNQVDSVHFPPIKEAKEETTYS